MNENPEDVRTAAAHRGPNHADYRETADLTNVHAAVQREHSVGTPGSVPMPLWLMILCGVAMFWAGTSFSGGFVGSYFSGDNYSFHPGEEPGVKGPAGAAAAAQSQGPSIVDQGKTYFSQNCQTCHQANGMGTPNIYPPLGGSEYVNGGTRRLGMIVLKGLQGAVTVEGHTFNGAMPSWEKSLTDKKLAAILTYVRQDFGNHAAPITPEQIADARKEFASHPDSWTEGDLKAVPPEAELPGGAAPAASPAAGGAK